MPYGLCVNVAGAWADRLARAFGLAQGYMLVPFKGIYKKLSPGAAAKVRGNIYPVPDARNPFLGVHFTRSTSGDVYAGPTAIPAFGRENYGILSGLDGEAFRVLWRDAMLFAMNRKFRDVALDELPKYWRHRFYADAVKLLEGLKLKDLLPTIKAGIRPQLVDVRTNELVMDFVLKEGENELHVLGAISPAFTSSMAFVPILAERIFRKKTVQVILGRVPNC